MVKINLFEDTVLKRLLKKAREKHGYHNVSKITHKRSYADCITEYNGNTYLWFDTKDGSTHMVSEKIEKEAQK